MLPVAIRAPTATDARVHRPTRQLCPRAPHTHFPITTAAASSIHCPVSMGETAIHLWLLLTSPYPRAIPFLTWFTSTAPVFLRRRSTAV